MVSILAPISSREAEEKSSKSNILIVSSIGTYYVPNAEVYYAITVVGAIQWLFRSHIPMHEIWLNLEKVRFDPTQPSDLRKPVGDSEDGLVLCDFLERFPRHSVRLIRVLTANPYHIKYIHQSLGKKYKICHNLPQNRSISNR